MGNNDFIKGFLIMLGKYVVAALAERAHAVLMPRREVEIVM